MRCFVGIELSAPMVEAMCRAADAIKAEDAQWLGEKWVSPDALHITLRFLGEVGEAELASARQAIGEAVAVHEAFELPVTGVSAVPNPRRCRLLWAAFADPEGACERLAGDVAAATALLGVADEGRRFRPHATLCRARRPKPIESAALSAGTRRLERGPKTVSVGTVTLFSSRLTPRGSVYSKVQVWHLRGV